MRLVYRPQQRDARTPLWYKLLYGSLAELTAVLGLITAAGALYESSVCTPPTTYLSANRALGYVALVAGVLCGVLGLYLLVRWSWVWCRDVGLAAPNRRYGEDIEDVEPGFLAQSSARSFLSTQHAADATKREVDLAWSDLEKTA